MNFFVMSRFRCYLLLFLACSVEVLADDREKPPAEPECSIYVLLEKKILSQEGLVWVVESDSGFRIESIAHRKRAENLDAVRCELSVKRGMLYINGRKLASTEVRIHANGDTPLRWEQGSYAGSLYIFYEGGAWYLVNRVELEEYVYSVLGTESWPGWPLEINKVLAVVLRTYVVSKMIAARRRARAGGNRFLYDILSTNMHQTYKGTHGKEQVRKAVEETAGQIISYKGKPIVAMYDICCGGVIPAHMEGINFEESPYLARRYACTFCSGCKAFSWEALYTTAELGAALREMALRSSSGHQISVSQKDRAGLVKELLIRSGKKRVRITGKKAYSLFKKIKSYCFSVSKSAQHYIFSGKGFGHHLGLCQWGAREMVRQGWYDWTKIVDFYYPETRVMRLVITKNE